MLEIIVGIGFSAMSILLLIIVWFTYRSKQQSETNEKKIDIIGVNVDGKMDKLLAAREEAAGALGQLKERDAERAHLSDTPTPIPIVNGSDDDPLKVIVVKE